MTDSIDTTFKASAWREQCSEVAKLAGRNCGSSFEIYQSKVSEEIDALLRGVAVEHRDVAVAIARREFEYRTVAELDQAEDEFLASGYCPHGIEPDCCPAGCGEIDWHHARNDEDDFDNGLEASHCPF